MSAAVTRLLRTLFACALVAAVMLGCGQKGPLYLPDEESPEDKQERPDASPGKTTVPY